MNTFKRTGLGSALLFLSAGLAFSQPPQPAPAAGVQASPGRGAQGPRVVETPLTETPKALTIAPISINIYEFEKR